ncbi:protease pro-enzyme activation domain-containing protein [Paraburkholderia sediminicola]|uniref:protease pro-enzyme activation domain-containing protein n=1 Tax=Paraburkholderia TaxID=1822464 RepID=UPI0038B8DE36
MFTRFQSRFRVVVLMLVTVFCTSSEAVAQTTRQLVTQVVDERQTIELTGNIRPEASAQNDHGRVDDTLVLDHMQLLLKRPAETEAALVRFIDLLHDPKSPYFHQWLTAEQFRANFGPADADVSIVSNWLSRHGLTVNGVQAGGMVIDFSGTAG